VIQLDIKVNSGTSVPAQAPVKFSTFSNTKAQAPVSRPVLTWHEEQQIYDRMYEAQVYKRGHFFGYRSTSPAHWHDSEQAREEAKKPVTRKEQIIEVLTGQGEPIGRLTDGELKRQHRYCLSDKLWKETYGKDR